MHKDKSLFAHQCLQTTLAIRNLLDVNFLLLDRPGNHRFGSCHTLHGTFDEGLARLGPLLERRQSRLCTGHPRCLDEKLCWVRLPKHLDRILQSTPLKPRQRRPLREHGWPDEAELEWTVAESHLPDGARDPSRACGHFTDGGRGPLKTCTHPDGTSSDCHPLRGMPI